jgi:predicted kinase
MTIESIVFIGLQASGKSTFFNQKFATTHELISKDLMPRKGKEERQTQLIEAALQAGKSLVVDNTNPGKADRAAMIRQFQAYQATIVGYYFSSIVDECMERNRQRTGKALVPDVGIYSTIKKLEKPSYDEGFDQLFHVQIGMDGEFIINPWSAEITNGAEKF